MNYSLSFCYKAVILLTFFSLILTGCDTEDPKDAEFVPEINVEITDEVHTEMQEDNTSDPDIDMVSRERNDVEGIVSEGFPKEMPDDGQGEDKDGDGANAGGNDPVKSGQESSGEKGSDQGEDSHGILDPASGQEGNEAKGSEHDHTEEKQPALSPRIIWLGDSLTQGSLGDRDDNLDYAPYIKLGELVKPYGNTVEGYGYYGYNTHDILWTYGETLNGQPKDKDAIYIFWCGSNDWVVDDIPNTETAGVMAEIDNFLANNGAPIEKYVVIGTTARLQLREGELYNIINAALASHYGNHYIEVNDMIDTDTMDGGYVIDAVHLKQESYDKVAARVFEKLKSLGYIG